MNIKNFSRLVIISLFAILFSACTKPAQQQNQNQNQQQAQNQQENLSGTIKDLIGLGRSVKCTWESPQGQGKGVVYASANKAKTEMEIDVDGQKMMINSLIDGDWMYQWGNSMMGNTKMNIKELEKMAPQQDQEQPQAAQNYNQELNYTCTPWGIDASVFNLPSDIEFTDTTQQMTNMMENAEQMQQDLCKMCQNLPEQAKADCLASCN